MAIQDEIEPLAETLPPTSAATAQDWLKDAQEPLVVFAAGGGVDRTARRRVLLGIFEKGTARSR